MRSRVLEGEHVTMTIWQACVVAILGVLPCMARPRAFQASSAASMQIWCHGPVHELQLSTRSQRHHKSIIALEIWPRLLRKY